MEPTEKFTRRRERNAYILFGRESASAARERKEGTRPAGIRKCIRIQEDKKIHIIFTIPLEHIKFDAFLISIRVKVQ